LDHGADPNKRPDIDCTPLSMAVLRAPVHIIELLLSRGGTVSHGQLIHYAASREEDDRLKVLDLLVSRKAPGLDEIMYHNSPEFSICSRKELTPISEIHVAGWLLIVHSAMSILM
jgi:hypothetical protein